MDNSQKIEFERILLRCIQALKIKNEAELREILGHKSTGTISGWRANCKVSDQALAVISRLTEIPVSRIEGSGPLRPYVDAQISHGHSTVREVDDEHARLIDAYNALEQGQKNTVIAMIEGLVEKSRAKDGGGSVCKEQKSA